MEKNIINQIEKKKSHWRVWEIFQEENGQFSSIRLLVVILILNAVVLSDILIYYGIKKYIAPDSKETLMAIVLAISTLLTTVSSVAGALKLFQKNLESKVPITPVESTIKIPTNIPDALNQITEAGMEMKKEVEQIIPK